MKKILTFTIVPLALFTAAAFAATIGGPEDIRSKLQAAGYSEIKEIEFDSGLWEADVRRADGSWADIAIDPNSGEIFDSRDGRNVLDVRGITDVLERAGYSELSDLESDGALWEAEARDNKGQRVELRISGINGRVLNVDVDHDD